jgi:UDPglucose 6-dehydrogenase
MKVAIIGRGILGRAQERMFADHDVVSYDITDGTDYPEAEIELCHFAVICVGTPPAPDGSCDIDGVIKAMDQLPDGLPILIRSTIPPGTVDCLQEDYPDTFICHAPDFLHEREGGQWPDSADVPYMLLGGQSAARAYFKQFLERVYPGKIYECDALTSEIAKYVTNLYWATRVTFVNEMGNLTKAFGGKWEEVRQAWLQDERVNPAYTKLDGFPPGFGGRCWPKDLSAIIEEGQNYGYDAEFLTAVEEANARFTGQSARG